ncbi:outer surface protein F precursor, putative [Trichomonas vaginalis G3]|uniref:Outer surface protein F, putative n=1 Tax=Trichomonas vaginalis (strain ATCC PRA-98 / G3) TaxID=412133 RepID=A2FFE1_TRIV3|nr:hypothetical protein TVAGG3_0118830 [Trichomonas vaginalis G3]XP_001321835.2 hypothetical protein TVAGG3_0882020 [Trichomonas vaginalis G3]EAX96387.1 outer surface protein F precursor, putative [Trichomonas vaginalis G3]KAI5502123.1 hypothetical protein TVAGG3_0882020 [Trichomonas vaginalis G3]KAI5545332.1 hypothetical protein TVAGG3_0118830 [Trichomonas vaginalis G3]|eukprot:XP_001309317.1 outer surface protein F precursor [Trichomonas vaginalis G3]
MFGGEVSPTLRDLCEKIKDKKVEMDAHIYNLQDENTKKTKELQMKIQSLREEEEKLKNSDKISSNSQKLEIEKLKQAKEELIKKRQFLKNRVEELESIVQKQEETKNSTEDPAAALTLYKSIAPITISSANQNQISGMIAYGTIDSTCFFSYNMDDLTQNQNDLWSKIDENRKKAQL